jgi:hypothetical protein
MIWMIFGWGGWVSAYGAFVERYPYMARKVWVLFLMESMGPIIDVYAFFTMNDDRWLTRAADAQYVEDQDASNIEKIQGVSEMLFKFTS